MNGTNNLNIVRQHLHNAAIYTIIFQPLGNIACFTTIYGYMLYAGVETKDLVKPR